MVAVRLALRSILQHPLRSLLTMLGILIGVAAIAFVTALGTGARARIMAEIQSIGSNLLFVWNRPTTRVGMKAVTQGLTDDDAAAIRREATAVSGATVWSEVRTQVRSEFGNAKSNVMGVDEHYFQVRSFKLAQGRHWSAAEQRSKAKVCIVGLTVIDTIFSGQDPIGRRLQIGKHPFLVIGTLQKKGQSPFQDQDDRILMPIDSWRSRVMPTPRKACSPCDGYC